LAEATGLYYEEHGPRDAPALVLSPGLGGSATYWAPNIPALAEHFRVIAYDHRGTGRSDRALPHVDFSADVVRLLDALKIDEVYFVGHAAGAVAGLMMALDWPQRLSKLVLVNGWSHLDPHFARCFDARLALLNDSGVAAYVRAQPIFLYPAEWSSSHSAGLDREAKHQIGQFPSIEVMKARIDALTRFDITDNYDSFDTPMLALAASDDMLVPAHCSRELADNIARCEFVLMDWGGHACNVTDPDTFNRIVLDFLRS